MKKIITVLAAMVMCLNLVACGGPDKQPAIDAYNELAENYNKFVEIGNENLSELSEEDIDFWNEVADYVTEYGETLEDDTEFTQEEIDEMVTMFNELNDIIVEALEGLGQ